jgi:hypothetical protein
LDYDGAARKPDDHTGKAVKFSGQVVQIMGDEYLDMRIALRGPADEYPDYDRIVYVKYRAKEGEPRILENDQITVYGISNGLETYFALLGGEIKIPLVTAKWK